MSTVKTKNVQIGFDADTLKNFTLRQPAVADGSLILSRGSADAPGATILTVNPQGAILLSDGTYVGCNGPRNRFRNGNLRINQRAVTSTTTDGALTWDGWVANTNVAGSTCTVGTNSVTNPSVTGGGGIFIQNGATVKASLSANDLLGVNTRIEGLNIADLLWGTSNAKPVSISFRAYASVATTIAVSIRNNAGTRSYVSLVSLTAGYGSYALTVPGCTDGTWLTDTNVGCFVNIQGAVGSTYTAPSANTWLSGNYVGVAGMSNICDTANRYFVLGDLQFEAGTVATPYEWRDLSDELRRCQRYYEPVAFSGSFFSGLSGVTTMYVSVPFKVTKRAVPTITMPPATNACWTSGGTGLTPSTWQAGTTTVDAFQIYAGATGIAGISPFTFPASAEL